MRQSCNHAISFRVDRQSTIDRLKALEPRLRTAGVGALYLFGSVARGDDNATSDIDLMFEVDDEANGRFSLIDQARIMLDLRDLFGRRVDFVARAGMYRPVRARAEQDMVRIF